MRRFGDGPETLSAISGLATNAASVNTSSQCMKSIIAELAVYNDPRIDPAAKQARVLAVVDFLQRALSAESHREVFSFSGKPGCGIGLLARKSLPSKGYCFCGWIRVERADQSMSGTRGKMTVFKLGASKSREIELFVRDGFLHYSVRLTRQTVDGRYQGEGAGAGNHFLPEKGRGGPLVLRRALPPQQRKSQESR